MTTLQAEKSMVNVVEQINRYAGWIKWLSVLVIVVGLLFIARQLPVQSWLSDLEIWINGMGVWGPIVFAGIYLIAVIVLLPGSPFTIAAGAIFGPLWGTIAASVGSVTGAACAFLIARYAARQRVAKMVQQYKHTRAIDQAISDGGWKVVAMLRLSPAVPFNLQNYFYGLTAIRFWPCVLTSWIAMLPGTFFYVYIGYLAREGVAAAAGGAESATMTQIILKWSLRIAALLATVGVVVYVTKLARKAMHEQPELEELEQQHEAAEQTAQSTEQTQRWPWGATIAALLALLVAACATIAPKISFGPPAVTMVEAYEPKPQGPSFDHAAFHALVNKHVDGAGFVDYEALNNDRGQLQSYIQAVAEAPFDEMGRNQKLALLINAYNAFTLELILEYLPEIDSIKDIPSDKRWDDARWQVGSHTWSLNQIEHQQIRPKFKEPRIHFVLVCAAYGCPPLRTEAYTADKLEAQLEDQTRYAHTHDRWLQYDSENNVVHLTKLYDWYGGDFEQAAGSVLQYVARYVPEVKSALEAGNPPSIQWIDYDWKLNSQRVAESKK